MKLWLTVREGVWLERHALDTQDRRTVDRTSSRKRLQPEATS
jgi:hypothetical protein